jgi:broad specificity phosphatase PhoE
MTADCCVVEMRAPASLARTTRIRYPPLPVPSTERRLTRMPSLILIRHSAPDIDPATPSSEWRLTPGGRDLSRSLARRIGGFEPATIVTSVEKKARETGEIIAGELGIPCQVRQGLHENDRQDLEIVDEDAYRALVARVFSQPDRVVMGHETAAMASVRFHSAVVDALDEAPDQTIAVVAHGVVMTLFVTRYNPIYSFEFWSGLGLPSAVVLDRNSFRLDRIIGV